jgi:hypothetical protein
VERPCFRWSRGSDPRLLRLTMNGLLDRTSGSDPRASSVASISRLDNPTYDKACARGVDVDQPRHRSEPIKICIACVSVLATLIDTIVSLISMSFRNATRTCAAGNVLVPSIFCAATDPAIGRALRTSLTDFNSPFWQLLSACSPSTPIQRQTVFSRKLIGYSREAPTRHAAGVDAAGAMGGMPS